MTVLELTIWFLTIYLPPFFLRDMGHVEEKKCGKEKTVQKKKVLVSKYIGGSLSSQRE